MLAIPDYITSLVRVDEPPNYTWNDADPGAIHRQDERLGTIISQMTDRAVVALSCGFAEWIAWRLHKMTDVRVLFDEIEAVWAGIIDWRYLAPLNQPGVTPRKGEWKGPARGPVYSTFYLLGDVVWRAKKRAYSAEASSCLSALAAHILPDAMPFLTWRKQTITRLTSLYPFVLPDRLGPPVPREALDPDFPFELRQTNDLLARYLTSLDYTQNRLLRSPQEMIADGFEGVPY